MFAQHQSQIASFAANGPTALAKVALLAIISPRVPFWRAVRDCATESFGGHFGYKREAWRDWNANKVRHYGTLGELAAKGHHVDAVVYAASRPGLGLAKAGFLLQCAWGFAGCLDTLNLDRLEIPYRLARADACKRGSHHIRLCRAARYLDLCATLGGTEQLWDQWCVHILAQSQKPGHIRAGHSNHNRRRWESADHVSAGHCLALGLSATWAKDETADIIPW